MHTSLCDTLDIELPIVGFTPSEHVAAAISRAGGLGVLGCVRFNDAEELDKVLTWMDEHTGGKPYGVDIVMPARIPAEGTSTDLTKLIPDEHRAFVDRTLEELGVPPLPEDVDERAGVLGWLHSVARSHVEVALKHPIKLIANALGSPPMYVVERAHTHGVPVAALAGKAEHAVRHAENGVDIVVAQGYEAGGHTGEIASMVLVPEIVEAVGDRVPVLAAGGSAPDVGSRPRSHSVRSGSGWAPSGSPPRNTWRP
jgi:NAD(P)H-dependent flavin oxidoreductase YrpB (nitropropane dioxygenase family)